MMIGVAMTTIIINIEIFESKTFPKLVELCLKVSY